MIQATGLTKQFGRIRAVDDVTFLAPRGEVVGFLGPNGAGKTTTIRMIAGYLTPSAGSVVVDDCSLIDRPRDARRRIGYLPESTPLYPEMRVRDYLKFRAAIVELPRTRRRSAIDLALRRCDLTDVQRRPVGQLSKGYRQRVGLAAALLHEPPVIILDEPTVGLDPSQIQDVRRLIRNLAGKHTILLSTHILPEVEAVCDRVIMIVGGRIRLEGSLRELRGSAVSRARYVVETTVADAQRRLQGIAGVSSVSAEVIEGSWRRLTLSTEAAAADLREPIARALNVNGGVTRELHRQVETLEELFIRLHGHADPRAAQ